MSPPLHGEGATEKATLSWKLDRAALRIAWRREGRYILRTNLKDTDPAKLWEYYLQLTEVEQAFKELKGDLAVRPIYLHASLHPTGERPATAARPDETHPAQTKPAEDHCARKIVIKHRQLSASVVQTF